MVCGAWVRLRRASSGGPRWSGWSSGRRSVGCISSGLSQREIHRRTGLHRDTIRRALTSEVPPRYRRGRRGPSSIRSRTRSVGCWARIRVCRESGSASCSSRWVGAAARRSSMTTCARSGRCSRGRHGRPAHDLSARRDLPVRRLGAARGGSGRPRPDAPGLGRGRVPGLLARRRRRAGVQQGDPGSAGRDRAAACGSSAGCPRTLVWDRQAGIHAHDGRPTDEFAAFCGQLQVGWHFCEPADPQAKGVVERLQGYAETNFEPGRVFANELDFQDQFDAWFAKANARTHTTLRVRPVDRLAEELEVMAPLPAMPDTVGAGSRGSRRIPIFGLTPVTTRWIPTGRPPRRGPGRSASRFARSCWTPASSPADHPRSFARHRTITALEHARALEGRRGRRRREAAVQIRSLARYDAADRMSRPTTELAHLFRQLKAPAAARALPKLADRARAEEWSYEQFAAALLKTETDSRDSHGGQARIKAARFPARKTLEEFDFAFQHSIPKNAVLHLGQLDFLAGSENVVLLGPARNRQDAPLDRAGDPRLPGRPSRRVQDRDRMGRAARRRPAPRPPRRRARQAATRPAADRRRGRLHPVRSARREPDVHARLAAATNAPR